MKKKSLTLAAALIGAVAVITATQLGVELELDSPPQASAPSTAPTPLSPIVSSSTSASLEAAGFATINGSDQAVIDPYAVADALEQLQSTPGDIAGYDRDLFGQTWADVDRNGCDTRNDVLARDLLDVTYKPNTRDCVVLTGTLQDTYTATTIPFERGERTSQLVQIDHLVPLSWAWQHGAGSWPEQQREEFANDPLNLQAVDGSTNSSKSDSGPAEWLPPSSSYHCEYAARFVLVLSSYQLMVNDADRGSLLDTLEACGQTGAAS